jgi:hypothetical protein
MTPSATSISNTKRKVLLIEAAVIVAGLISLVIVINRKRKAKDQKAIAFFSELQRDIAPGSVGLVESNAFDIRYWETIGKKVAKPLFMLTSASARGFATEIHNAWGMFDDDENKIYGVFRALKDQVQVSQVAYHYYQSSKDKINLIDDLKGQLNKDEVSQVLEIVKRLPGYRIAEQKKK